MPHIIKLLVLDMCDVPNFFTIMKNTLTDIFIHQYFLASLE